MSAERTHFEVRRFRVSTPIVVLSAVSAAIYVAFLISGRTEEANPAGVGLRVGSAFVATCGGFLGGALTYGGKFQLPMSQWRVEVHSQRPLHSVAVDRGSRRGFRHV